ncbi:hypothetical protein RL73_02610 [Liberibacter crescens]|nr:hypothetical protein RL73_02610 [Liberibacter crescens]
MVCVEVENPLYLSSHGESVTNPRHIMAHVNVGESAITTLAVRGHIDACQARAAVRFRALWEAAGGMDYVSVNLDGIRVDGGARNDGITENRMSALQQLVACRNLLGVRAYGLMIAVAGQGKAISDMGHTKHEKNIIASNIKNCLEDLAIYWGYKSKDV